jgi:hypothetical protein
MMTIQIFLKPGPTDALGGKEYRLPWQALAVGIICTTFFVLMGIGSSTAAALNVDGSFPFPLTYAIIFGVFWSCMALLGVWLILSHRYYRLYICDHYVRETGCLRTRMIALNDVTRATWGRFCGRLVLQSHRTKLSVWFQNFGPEERSELIIFFHQRLGEPVQHGWERFAARCIPLLVDLPRPRQGGHLRVATGFLLFGSIFIALSVWNPRGDVGHRCLYAVAGVANLLISGHRLLLWRRSRNEAAGEADQGAEKDEAKEERP